jgi:hypothetical protein
MIDSDIHRLLISGIVQRPIAFVSISEESVENLAPFRCDAPPVSNALCTLIWLASVSWFNSEQYTKTWLFIAYNFIP